MGLIDAIRSGTYVPDPDGGPHPGKVIALTETSARIRSGGDVLAATRDFLDQVPRISPLELGEAIRERPELTGNGRADALLAGVAEHLAASCNVACPAWVHEPERFLDRFWFVSDVRGFRAVALAQAAMALKRRGILWPARSLQRV